MMKRHFIFVACSFLILGCQIINTANPDDPVVLVSDDDAHMNQAIQHAQQTLYFFIQNLQSPKPGQTYFGIKGEFVYGTDGIEQMWVGELEYLEQQFNGILESDPLYVRELKFGDHVTVHVDNVSDWMIIQDGRLVGGFTLKVIRDQMTPEEREQFDQSLGLVVDYPATPIPTQTP